jgi:pilus assembly protein CpaC
MRLPRTIKWSIPVLIMFSLLFSVNAGAAVPVQIDVNKCVMLKEAQKVQIIVNNSVILSLNDSKSLNKEAQRVQMVDESVAFIYEPPFDYKWLMIIGKKVGATSLLVWQKGVEKLSSEVCAVHINVVQDLDLLVSQIKEMAPKDAISVDSAMDTIILSGNVANAQTRTKAEEIAKAYAAGTKVLNHININNPQQVVLQVKVAQVDKTALKKLGISGLIKGKTGEGFYNLISAPDSFISGIPIKSSSSNSSGSSGTSSSGDTGLGSISSLAGFAAGISYFPAGIGAVLQALTTKGLAKILAEPNLLVKSGEKGEFLAGSKIPYSVLVSSGGSATTSIVFEQVGVKLNFAPVVLENGNIALNIDPAEVSGIQGTLAVNGYPVIDTRTVKTSVELKDGESLVLAGLLSENTIKTMSKIPLLGDIPILGALFRSTQNDLEEKELVFFITPKIAKVMAPGTKLELPTYKALTPEQENELKWMPREK